MSKVLQFFHPMHLRLDTGVVRDPGGERHGQRMYWLEYVEADGGRCNIWQGYGYEQALAEAKDCLTPGMRFEDTYARGDR